MKPGSRSRMEISRSIPARPHPTVITNGGSAFSGADFLNTFLTHLGYPWANLEPTGVCIAHEHHATGRLQNPLVLDRLPDRDVGTLRLLRHAGADRLLHGPAPWVP